MHEQAISRQHRHGRLVAINHRAHVNDGELEAARQAATMVGRYESPRIAARVLLPVTLRAGPRRRFASLFDKKLHISNRMRL
jgi:hypothetical protein